eukprot:c15278_g1_i1.p1 GENE.c15278_g1_i1~~c15278_g1_i1.p1  ORF type:complete len:585 (+),score=198.95 c15278_g1_i1:46-1800(+)
MMRTRLIGLLFIACYCFILIAFLGYRLQTTNEKKIETKDIIISDLCGQFNGIPHPKSSSCCPKECKSFCGSKDCNHSPLGNLCCLENLHKNRICSKILSAPCHLNHEDKMPPIKQIETIQPYPSNPSFYPNLNNSFSIHECTRSLFTHHCHLKFVTMTQDQKIIGHHPNARYDIKLEIPVFLSPRYNKPKVLGRNHFPPSVGSVWDTSSYNEKKCDQIFGVPVYVFQYYFTSNFFHLINDNFLPLYATIEKIEGVGAVERTRARQIIYYDDPNRKISLFKDSNLEKWSKFLESLTDRPILFWHDISVNKITCFRELSLNLVDSVHLLNPITNLSPEAISLRTQTMQSFRKSLYKSFEVEFPKIDTCDPKIYPKRLLTIVSRKEGGPRYIQNENELINIANELSYDAISLVLDGMNFQEQLKKWSKTCVFVASHGAGVMNALFLPPNASVIQIFSFGLRQDYAKSSVDCGSICYRGQYVGEMTKMLYGEGHYGEIMVELKDSKFFKQTKDHNELFKNPFEMWILKPIIGVNILIKGPSSFKVNTTSFREVLMEVSEQRGKPIDFGELPPQILFRLEKFKKVQGLS